MAGERGELGCLKKRERVVGMLWEGRGRELPELRGLGLWGVQVVCWRGTRAWLR